MATPVSDGEKSASPTSTECHAFSARRRIVRRVLLLDASAERRQRVDAALAGIEPRPQLIVDPHSPSPLRRSTDLALSLVGVDPPGAGSTALDTIAILKSKGGAVVCYGDGANGWPLDAHCRLLLGGASCVLDSAAGSFDADVRDTVEHWMASEADRLDEDRRVQQQMRERGVVGISRAMTAVFRWVQHVSALSDVPVLVVGETGTGKELVARAIHARDPRRSQGPFVPLNCAAISAGLAESELFGHRRGAFTGADHDRQGLIRAARGGVLFLDEVGDLEAPLQAKLLRVLQERRLLAIGDDHEVPIDVRVIAATNRDLDSMVAAQTFRADLFHRISALSVRIPPLRERPADVAPLVEHFLQKSAAPGDRQVPPTRAFLEALTRAELPGNVRQLENVVRRAIVNRRPRQPLALCDLPPELWAELSQRGRGHESATIPHTRAIVPAGVADRRALITTTPTEPQPADRAGSWKLERALELCEQTMVAAALDASRGNRARAARLLGISPRSIFNKMRKYQLTA
ncbi:MAG: sigma 54-interacting transcriptional regulator [Acidobacteriota bacterium]|nr:sigma 54-interacting transcriptional regulator [Acidobacteriota bacterium]